MKLSVVLHVPLPLAPMVRGFENPLHRTSSPFPLARTLFRFLHSTSMRPYTLPLLHVPPHCGKKIKFFPPDPTLPDPWRFFPLTLSSHILLIPQSHICHLALQSTHEATFPSLPSSLNPSLDCVILPLPINTLATATTLQPDTQLTDLVGRSHT